MYVIFLFCTTEKPSNYGDDGNDSAHHAQTHTNSLDIRALANTENRDTGALTRTDGPVSAAALVTGPKVN